MKLNYNAAPNYHSKASTKKIMGELTIVLLVVYAYAVVHQYLMHGMTNAIHIVILLLCSVTTAILCELIWGKLVAKTNPFKYVRESFPWVTAIILTMMMPANIGIYPVVIAGGPMMGKTVVKDEFVIGTYSDAITVLKYQDQEALACLRCGRCSEACPAGLQPVRINNAFKSKDIELIRLLGASQCIECGSCTYVCPSNIAVTEGIRQAKTLLALHPLKKPEEKGGKK